MQDDFRNVLLIIVIVLIGLILMHSLWSMKKKNKIKTKRKGASKIVVPEREEEIDNPEIISEVRVRPKPSAEEPVLLVQSQKQTKQQTKPVPEEQPSTQAFEQVKESESPVHEYPAPESLTSESPEIEEPIDVSKEGVNEDDIETLVAIEQDGEGDETVLIPNSDAITVPSGFSTSIFNDLSINAEGFAPIGSSHTQSEKPSKNQIENPQKSLFDEDVIDEPAAPEQIQQKLEPATAERSPEAEKPSVQEKQPLEKPAAEKVPAKKSSENKKSIRNNNSSAAKAKKTASNKPAPTAKPPAPDLQIVLFIAAKQNQSIQGQQLLDILTTHHLRFGEYKIFHRYDENEDNSLFCVANAMNPGHFSIKTMPAERFQALCLIMSLPNASSDVKATFDEMVNLAGEIAESCDAIVLDDQKVELTVQTVGLYKEHIAEYQLKNRYKKDNV